MKFGFEQFFLAHEENVNQGVKNFCSSNPRVPLRPLRKLWALFLFALFIVATAQTMNEFVEGVTVEPTVPNTFQKLILPYSVYQYADTTLHDLRLFNTSGEAVPFTFLPRANPTVNEQSIELKFFPLTNQEASPETLELLIETPDGTRLDIERSTNGSLEENRTGYLLDMREVESFSSLTLEWSGNAEFMSEVQIESSNDLTLWTTLGRGVIARLKREDDMLTQNRLEFPKSSVSYLRLSSVKVLPELATITTTLSQQQETQPRWLELTGNKIGNTFHFETVYTAPFEFANIVLPENSLVRATLQSRATPDAIWTTRYQGTLYHLESEGATLSNPRLELSTTHDRYWQLLIDERDSVTTASLSLGFIPETLLFIAKDNTPFTLAYGHTNTRPTAFSFDEFRQLLPDTFSLETLPTALVGEPFKLAGVKALSSEPTPKLPWRQMTLWAVLVAGVLVLVGFAVRLLRQFPPTS